jgi:hypothetical protein
LNPAIPYGGKEIIEHQGLQFVLQSWLENEAALLLSLRVRGQATID